jgi:predicted phosphodiesterase
MLSMLRILSDLHFRDASSRLLDLAELNPLLKGVSQLWLNGDTCDNQTGMPPAAVEETRQFFQARVPEVRFITGNHDPDISDTHQCTAADGRLFATHGDAFLDEIVPWSRVRQKLRTRVQQAQYNHPKFDPESLDGRLALFRAACLRFPRECDPEKRNVAHRFRRFTLEFFPPRQPWAMLRTWMSFADRVAARRPEWCPAAQVITTGHIHFPRVWRRGPLTVINTGAFSGPLGAFCVDLEGEIVTVRRLKKRADGWHAETIVTTIALAPHRDTA